MLAHRRHFSGVHQHSPWQAGITVPGDGKGPQKNASSEDVDLEVFDETLCQASPEGVRFPVKAFAQMCLTEPPNALRLESHVVETLVLGSDDVASIGASVVSGGSTEHGEDDWVALGSAKRDGLDAICAFHGVGGWSSVTESAVPWQEVLWDWYDARF